MAGFSVFRFFRFLRSLCAPITACIGFSCLLAFIFILYQPTPGPGIVQKLGWQSWDLISMTDAQVEESTHTSAGSVATVPEGVDWWNVSKPQDNTIDAASLPLDEYAPLLPHDTGLSEISVQRCMFGPFMAQLCYPPSTPEQDAIKGKWVRVNKDLNRQSGLWHLNIYYRRTRRLDIPLVAELKLLPDSQSPPSTEKWIKTSRSIRDGVSGEPPLYLWYRTGKTVREMTTQEKQEDLITELDVLYGADRPWYGFDKLEPSVTIESGRVSSEWITYRKGVKRPPAAPPLHFSHDGRFKILQVADLHFSIAHTDCKDSLLSPCKDSDNLTSTLLGHILDEEKPDLVVFTGDQLNGQGTTWDTKSVFAKFAVAVTERRIPWTAVFGNHDDEDGAFKDEQMKLLQALPYNLVERGPKDVHGVGNYVLKVKSADPSKTHLLTLYFLDSGSYSKGYFDWLGWFRPTEYDYLHQSQINWFLQESGSINSIERPFSPDTAKDLGVLWERQSADQLTPETRKLAKPNAMMFFHIPLQESYSQPDKDTHTGASLDVGLRGLEPKGAAKKNEGFFEKALLAAMESEHLAKGSAREVKVVGNGHCHLTENCRRVKGVWLCFGGGGSYSGYSKIGFDKRFRVYDVYDYGETIRTYKRTEKDVILDEMILVGRGAAPAYTGRR
ncbi:hypothetical protein PILCRDRAFT_819843 [Piloderma croceum F 1598]|uniref:Calcineurin-like phosphoesterase domain-containing protein n=1 Tax=Piloderma croceum (strain F 1598) TaxID=765440 RepID=A0A0C3FWV6_PILCF|nr:hypothetical protein PILCRDRAFT_819843 [Piloderma croceum F 1598]